MAEKLTVHVTVWQDGKNLGTNSVLIIGSTDAPPNYDRSTLERKALEEFHVPPPYTGVTFIIREE